MRKWLVLLTGIVAIGLCGSSAVCAKEESGSGIRGMIRALLEDEDVKDALFGDNGLVNEILPEGAGLQTVEEQIGLVQSHGAQIINTIREKMDSGDTSYDLSDLESLVGSLAGAITGFGDGEDADLFGVSEVNDIIDTMKEFYLGRNAGTMDPSDVQIVSMSYVYQDDDYDQPEFRFLSYLSQSDYSQDGNVLRFVSGAGEPGLFTFTKEEDGTFIVVDAVFAEDGEGWTDSLQAMADEVGCSVEDILDAVDFSEYDKITDLLNYLDEHEDIEGIEYMGEVKTHEELEEIRSAFLDEYIDGLMDETEAEQTEAK